MRLRTTFAATDSGGIAGRVVKMYSGVALRVKPFEAQGF